MRTTDDIAERIQRSLRPRGTEHAVPFECLTHFPDNVEFLYSTEASTIGLGPGQWPDRLVVTGADGQFGNGLPFVSARRIVDRPGELSGVQYTQSMGTIKITVLND